MEGDRRVGASGVKRRADNAHLTWVTKLTSAHHPCRTKEKGFRGQGGGMQAVTEEAVT